MRRSLTQPSAAIARFVGIAFTISKVYRRREVLEVIRDFGAKQTREVLTNTVRVDEP